MSWKNILDNLDYHISKIKCSRHVNPTNSTITDSHFIENRSNFSDSNENKRKQEVETTQNITPVIPE